VARRRAGGCRPFELAAALEWKEPAVDTTSGGWSSEELVNREECEGRRRGALLVSAPLGAEALHAGRRRHVEIVRQLGFDGLNESQVRPSRRSPTRC